MVVANIFFSFVSFVFPRIRFVSQAIMAERVLAPLPRRDLRVLDRSLFNLSLPVKALRVAATECGRLMKECQRHMLGLPRLRNIVNVNESSKDRLVLLKLGIADIEELPPLMKGMLQNGQASLVDHELTLDYDYWSAEQILTAVLPEDLVPPSSFETIGHIAHLNLRDQYLPYKNIIGQVIIDKNKGITCVVNKTDSIDTQFRFFQMEVLAGVNDTITELKENGCLFRFDFSKVYWNSRLHHEHERLINSFQPGEVIVDMMAGVGPFAIPAAKRGCTVFANDLNPNSYAALVENSKRNKVEKNISNFNLDGREFVQHVFKQRRDTNPTGKVAHHVIMNLPASAIEFLDAFKGVLRDDNITPDQLPTIHCYCFSHFIEEPDEDILQRVDKSLGMRPTLYQLHRVRSVAPNKDMFCLTFPLPIQVVQNETHVQPIASIEPPNKKTKLELDHFDL